MSYGLRYVTPEMDRFAELKGYHLQHPQSKGFHLSPGVVKHI